MPYPPIRGKNTMTMPTKDEEREAEALASVFATALMLTPESALPIDNHCINRQNCDRIVSAYRNAQPASGKRSERIRKGKSK